MNHLGTKTLETERLVLRPFKETDVEDMYQNWASNNNVTKYLTWPTHTSKDITKPCRSRSSLTGRILIRHF